jgi:transcriptional antiterminator RfaH
MSVHWYALHSKPMKETLLWEQLGLHEIESYYPQIQVRPVNPRSRRVKAYFPGYVFGRFDLEQTNISTLLWLPGSAGIVSFGGVPSLVPDNLLSAIRRRVDDINSAGSELFYSVKSGDVLSIQDGPFKGYEAIFATRLSGDERVRVLLRVLNGQQITLDLPGRQLQLKKQ